MTDAATTKVTIPELQQWVSRLARQHFGATAITLGRNFEETIISDIFEHRKPVVDAATTITAGELEAWMGRNGLAYPRGVTFTSASEVVRDIVSRRKPVYAEGTVVRDEKGEFFQRKGSGWLQFGSIARLTDEFPVYPLRVIS